jgi:hypothetical protein
MEASESAGFVATAKGGPYNEDGLLIGRARRPKRVRSRTWKTGVAWSAKVIM